MFARLLAGFAGLALALPAYATIVTFDDKAAFLSSTGATNATGPLPSLGYVSSNPITVGSVTFSSQNALWFGAEFEPEGDWTTLLPGHEIAVNSWEDLDVSLAAPVYSFGFDFVEPETGPNVNDRFVDSTFNVTLFSDTTPVGAFTFNAPNDVAAFVGVWTDMLFNRVEIREAIHVQENEFFGEVYTGVNPVPIPAALPLFLTALAGLGFVGWRRRGAKLLRGQSQ